MEPCSLKEIHAELHKAHSIAYTTVATLVQRLVIKGLVVKKDTNSFQRYSSKMSKEVYTKNVAQAFFQKLVLSFGDTAIVSFAKSIEKLPLQKRKYLVELINEYDKNQ
jgi:predicted transcriptional regulator